MIRGTAARRGFFSYLASETLVWCEEMRGVRHVKLSEIPGFPPAVFAALIPHVRPGVQILPGPERVCARVPGVEPPAALFPATDAAALAVFNCFNGQRTLGEIAAGLATTTAWSAEESMARVRALFLRLVELRVCEPCNSVPVDETGTTSSGSER
jgi:hypothetical protein